jgi:Heterokaryon incompatibility protein (HET)
MYLINTHTYRLEEFLDETVKQYAILSHRWGDNEVSFRQMQNPPSSLFHNQKFEKILNTCKQARKDGWPFVWVDTCCINKESSAELSEAINSMFRWYSRAQVCYVYLFDVDPHSDGDYSHPSSLFPTPTAPNRSWELQRRQVEHSDWFNRGWTLQELIAPKSVDFFDRSWNYLGSKWILKDRDLLDLLERRTGIPTEILRGYKSVHDQSVAQRMSWVSQRRTSRVEDIAYCLLGIFDINMPLL